MPIQDAAQTFGLITAAVGAGGAVWKTWRVCAKGVRRVIKALEDVDRILKEVTPNGGGSIKDMVSGQNKTVTGLQEKLGTIHEEVTLLSARVSIGHDAYGVGTFTAGPTGFWTDASPAHCRAVGRPVVELTGFGWLETVEEESRSEVREEWGQCVHDKRSFDREVEFVTPDGRAVPGRMMARPVLRVDGTLRGWQGFINYRRRQADNP